MATVHKFDTPNAAGTPQYVAHGLYHGGGPYSIWFSAAGLVDAECRRRDGKTYPVSRKWLVWGALERKIPGLIAQCEGER